MSARRGAGGSSSSSLLDASFSGGVPYTSSDDAESFGETSCDGGRLQENNGEKLLHVVITLAQKIGFSLEERDIVNAYRLGARINAVESRRAGSEGTQLLRAVVVRLTRRYLRDEFLHAARVRRGVDTMGMGLGGEPRRFYVNEHLTRVNRKLFYLAREELARQRNWRFVGTRGGIICARRDQKSSVHVIRSEQDISKVFGKE
ncbi:unnamed protein product [Leptidea sinapis]|uniref:FP protein C-terminal domain-containing protein n=1 Tax=Leptidea sinapis TaxID=189913 RepID=A0A5E4QYW9_9NEOP|nr:unnamed protein product [Leptidea sinapis]